MTGPVPGHPQGYGTEGYANVTRDGVAGLARRAALQKMAGRTMTRGPWGHTDVMLA